VIVGIGMDLIEIERVGRMVSVNEERALKRLFTFREVDYAKRHANPDRHYAARLAAKEAAYKALSGNDLARAINWKDIEVGVRPDGQPFLEFHGHAKRRAAELGVTRAWVTLTHSEGTAAAVVILEADGGLQTS
jgi:holo-[acyl-carrier protein] synthase